MITSHVADANQKEPLRLHFLGEPENQTPWFLTLAQRRFPSAERSSKDPDFVFVPIVPGVPPEQFVSYACPRILVSFGENYCPDFNVFNYVIGWNDLQYGDRFYRYLLWMNYFRKYSLEELKSFNNHLYYNEKITKPEDRPAFCDFIYSHLSHNGKREELLNAIEQIKPVSRCGSFMNNMPDGNYPKNYGEKLEMQKQSKFSIACEAVSMEGFSTEKVLQPFLAGSIPIYYGDKNIASIFNPKAFVNCHDFSSFQEAAEYVRYLDSNEEAYLEMLNQPIFNDALFPYKMLSGLEDFLEHVFSQDPKDALRRPDCMLGLRQEALMKEYEALHKTFPYRVLRKIKFDILGKK